MNDKKLYDTRILSKNLQKGLIKEADLKAHIKSLPDESANAQWIEMDIHETDSNGAGNHSGNSDSEG